MTSSKLPHLTPPIKPEGPGGGYSGGSPGSRSPRGSPGSRRSSVFDESSDEEDQVSLTFPEELLAKPLPFASKFGSPYHTPETDSRSAQAIQDKGSKVESANGTNGTSGLFGFAAKLFDMFGFQAGPAEPVKPLGTASEGLPKPFRPSETAIIFDWDDTLFPTWHVVQTVEGTLPADDAFRAKLDRVSETVRELLTRAKSCGQVAIVTLSRRPWVTNSANEFLPKLEIEALLKELRIPVIYSRECLKPYMMRSPDGDFEEGVCPLTMAKELAMKKVLKKLYGKNPWKNVLSIGDSVTERTAITELLWAHMGEDARSCCKTLKMLQDPSIDQLQMELGIIKDTLSEMAQRSEDFSLCIDESGQKVSESECSRTTL